MARDPRIDIVIRNFRPRFMTSGVPLADFEDATDGLEKWEDWLPRWAARGEIHEALGRAALAAGNGLSAGEHLTMAALLAVAIMYGDGAGATAAGISFTGQTFPPMCGF